MANQKFKSKVQADAGIQLTAETSTRALQLDGSGNIQSSSVTNTELGYVAGLTSSAQTQISNAQSDATQALSNAANAQSDINTHIADTTGAHAASAISNTPSGNLVATDVQGALNEIQTELDGVSTNVSNLITLSGVSANSTDLGTFTGTIIPDSSTIKGALQSLETFVGAIPSPFYYAGTWVASTNTPTLANTDTGVAGAVYYVTDSGTVNFGAGAMVFNAGDKVANNGTTWDKWDMTDSVVSVNGQSGVVVLSTSNIAEGSNLYFTDERAQDAVGAMTANSSTVSLTYVDATPSLTAAAITQLSITSDASGLKLVNDVATPGNTQYYGTNGSGTKGFFPIPAVGSAGDIQETSFAASNNIASPANVTGLAFAAGTVRSFKALVSVALNATTALNEAFELSGIQLAVGFVMAVSSVGDDSGVVFTITSAGQIQYTSTNASGFVSDTIKFRAQTTSV